MGLAIIRSQIFAIASFASTVITAKARSHRPVSGLPATDIRTIVMLAVAVVGIQIISEAIFQRALDETTRRENSLMTLCNSLIAV